MDLAESVLATVQRGRRFIVVGGDHSCAIGTWSAASLAIRDRGSLGLVWIDAHMDSHTPQTSPSGAAHGMPLACLLGYGDPELTELLDPKPKLEPRHVCLVGVRSYEEEEAGLLNHLGVRVITMEEIHRHGLAWAMEQAFERASEGTAGYGISIDLDAIDPTEAPGVGSPAPDGLHGQELVAGLARLPEQPILLGIEITEFNPLHDQDNCTAHLVCDLLNAGLARLR
jgi:arginase